MNDQITIVSDTEYHHMPDYSDRHNLCGMTLCEALKTLREVDFGDMGGTHVMGLSDGTWLEVTLEPTSDCHQLMSSQRATRTNFENGRQKVIRHYQL